MAEGDAGVRFQNARVRVLSYDGSTGASHDSAQKYFSASFKTDPELLALLPEKYLRPEFLSTHQADAALQGQINELGDVRRVQLIRALRDKLQSQGACK